MKSSLRARAMLFSGRMRRKVQIVFSLIAVILLIRPFDCLALGVSPSETAECCMKGKCGLKVNADACCRASVPDGNQPVPATTAVIHASPVIYVAPVQFVSTVRSLCSEYYSDMVQLPPGLNRAVCTPPLLI